MMKRSFFGVLSLSLLWSPCSLWATQDLGKIWENNQAVKMQRDKKMVESFDKFATLLGQDPFHPLFQFNMGTAFFSTEDVEKAKKLFLQLDRQKNLDPALSFAVAYNLGVLNGLEKNVDQALEFYQKALEYQPNSEQTKINIELLIQQKKGGGGKSKDKNKDKKKKGSGDPQDGDDKGDEEKEKEPQKMRNKVPEYKGADMSKGDVKKILEELKKQEQKIRAKHDRKGKKEKDRGKNW